MVDQDVIVAWSATTALHFYVDHAGFTIESFLGFLPHAFAAVFVLLDRLKEVETKAQVLNFVNVVIRQMGSEVTPFVPQLVEKLESLRVGPFAEASTPSSIHLPTIFAFW